MELIVFADAKESLPTVNINTIRMISLEIKKLHKLKCEKYFFINSYL